MPALAEINSNPQLLLNMFGGGSQMKQNRVEAFLDISE